MLDNIKIAEYIYDKRKRKGLTQQQVADELNVSYQAVSKWENGTTYPSIDILYELACLLDVTIDEIVKARDAKERGLTYSESGVDISYSNSIKNEMSDYINSENERVLNGLGPFASLYDIKFDDIRYPVLVLKSEEPGSKQKLAMKYGYTESICHDMINHLVNDIVVMGAKPLAVLDTIICGGAEKDTIKSLIKGMSEACKENECDLVGGETSIQPNVVDKGVYILSSSVTGIVDKDKVIDGAKIKGGDKILAVASNGLHTNGYSLVRMLIDKTPNILRDKIDNETLLETIMKPHTPYYKLIKPLFNKDCINGMAHITGGGIEGNLSRIIPKSLSAKVDLSKINVLPVFRYIKERGNVDDDEMLRTFNCGVGFIIVVDKNIANKIIDTVSKSVDCYEIGDIVSGDCSVELINDLNW